MLDSFKDWWKKPYSDDMSVKGWFLFFGLIVVISVLWSLVLREIRELAN